MRTFIGLIVGAAIATATLRPANVPLAPVALAQEGPPTVVDPRLTTISWNPPEWRKDGSPLEDPIARYYVAYWPSGADIEATTPSVEVNAGSGTTLELASLVSGQEENGDYQVAVRAVDAGGYSSAWSEPLVQTWQLVSPPQPPAALRVILVLNPDGTVRWEESP